MQISQSNNHYNAVDYYPLPNGKADVFLHRNETAEQDIDGNTVYTVEEVYFRIAQSVTKQDIEANFDMYWGKQEPEELTELEKLKQRIYNAEQIAADNSQTQQEMIEMLIEIGVI